MFGSVGVKEVVCRFCGFVVCASLIIVLASATAQGADLRLVTEEDVFGQNTRDDLFDIIGIGRMMQKVTSMSGIKMLAGEAQNGGDGGSGRMGARLRTVMSEAPFFELDATESEGADLSSFYDRPVIVDSELAEGNEAFQQGRMYPPRLSLSAVDFPTFHDHPEFRKNLILQTERLFKDQFSGAPETRIRIEIRDDRYHLTGAVSSADDRKVAELMLAMEPGVGTIVNELRVVAPSPSSSPQQREHIGTEIPSPGAPLDLDVVR